MSDTPKINLSLSLDEMTDFADKVRDMFGEEVDGDGEYKPAKHGVKAGLREGETRVTCVFKEDETRVLHDWAKTTGRTFREVCLAMCGTYIETVIKRAAEDGVRLNLSDNEMPPSNFTYLYESVGADRFERYF